jgi:hypothetical protein
MAMDLLERYLQAVGQYLPEDSREDTLAELRANLLEQMDARAEELGRPLGEGDVTAILRQHGKPELVALRYLPQRSLIGPTIFPFYVLTLTRVLPLVVFVSFMARGIQFASSQHESLAHALGSFALGLWSSLLISAAIITVIFAVIELAREHGKLGPKWHEWDPAKLPAAKTHVAADSSPRSLAKRVSDLSVHCAWMAFVLWVPWHPFWILGSGVFYMDSLNVTFAPVWHAFYGLLVVLLTVQLGMKLLAFVPSAQRLLRPMKIATDLLGVVAIGLLAASSTYFVAAGAAADVYRIASVNHSVGIAFRIAFVCVLLGFLTGAWKVAKRWVPKERLVF